MKTWELLSDYRDLKEGTDGILYCCDDFKEWHNSARVRFIPDSFWVFCINSEFAKDTDWKWAKINLCPFCGKNLRPEFCPLCGKNLKPDK